MMLMEQNYIAVDLETTGLSPRKDRIIEIGAVKIVGGMVVEEFSHLVDPQIILPDHVTELTGITDQMLSGAETIGDVFPKFLAFAGELPLLGHNILFDYSFLKTEAVKEKYSFERKGIDTLYLSRALHEELESKSLDSMCRYYGIINENHHRALDDARASVSLYEALACHKDASVKLMSAKPLLYRPKKIEPATPRQKNYLNDLVKYHKIDIRQSIDTMTRSEASRFIDKILFQYGRRQN